MPKRKTLSAGEQADNDGASSHDSDEENGEEENINVDFEFFNPQEHDFHGIRNLLRQLFDVDAALFDLSGLSHLILGQSLLGSTVKCDGNEGDPFAFLSIINLNEHKENPAIKSIIDYLVEKSKSVAKIHETVQTVLSSGAPNNNVGLILTERLLNMPMEVSPPMYNMLLEEIEWAVEEKEPYHFDHYLVLSKVYTEVQSKLDGEDGSIVKRQKGLGKNKKKNKDKRQSGSEVFYFHPEVETLQQASEGTFCRYSYTHEISDEQADAKRAFFDAGIKSQGNMILLSSEQFKSAIQTMLEN